MSLPLFPDREPEQLAPPEPAAPVVLSVSQLTSAIKNTLEGTFPAVWVAGEISNFSKPQSGHCYFTLKDEDAQIRAVVWRSSARALSCELHDGMEVVCQGSLDVYAPRGSYQLIVSKIEPLGLGALQQRLKQLMQRLSAEGCFDAARKRPLPRFPRRIAVVTSPTSAAVRDFLQVMSRRWRGVDVLIVPARVQGDGSAEEIARAIGQVNRLRTAIDTLVVCRGGGSLEDLWSFNEEVVVRAICASRIPVVSAVGHEIDVTLADLAADVRALTPSEAAELCVPARADLAAALADRRQRLSGALRNRALTARRRLEALAAARVLRRPEERVHALMQGLDDLQGRARRAMGHRLLHARHRAGALADQLDSLSPLKVLARGYSLTERADSGQIIRDAGQLAAGDTLRTRFGKGQAISRVVDVDE